MKVTLVSTHDRGGGAANAAYRLLHGLRERDIEAKLLTQFKQTADEQVLAPPSRYARAFAATCKELATLNLRKYPQRRTNVFSDHWLCSRPQGRIQATNPDLIHLHWVNAGFLSFRTIAALKTPIVWTLHDMWAFTGGCHYSYSCTRFLERCGACPELGSTTEQDLTKRVWWKKARAWDNFKPLIVTPSAWLQQLAQQSSLFHNHEVVVIPNGIALDSFKPVSKSVARTILNIGENKKVILFGAVSPFSDTRKGYELLLKTLRNFSKDGSREQVLVLVFGTNEVDPELQQLFECRALGLLQDDLSLRLAFSSANVFVAPSKVENLPYTVMEAMAVGTPAAAFSVGGIPEMIEDGHSGVLAAPFDTEELGSKIKQLLFSSELQEKLSQNARAHVEQRYALPLIADEHVRLYERVLETAQKS